MGLELQISLRAAGSEVGAHHTIKHTADTQACLCSIHLKCVSWTDSARHSVVSSSGERGVDEMLLWHSNNICQQFQGI